MATWNMFSDEVADELYNIGIGLKTKPQSYKQQALSELAHRLELESKIKEMKLDMLKLIDEVEELRDKDPDREMLNVFERVVDAVDRNECTCIACSEIFESVKAARSILNESELII